MEDSEFQRLIESGWRGQLNDAEAGRLRAWLAAHQEARARWEAEAALTGLLERLPAVPAAASNFTATVLRRLELEQGAAARESHQGWRIQWLRARWLPRVALAFTLVLVLGLAVWHGQQLQARRTMAQSLAQLYPVVTAHPDLMENMDAILRLSDQPRPDTDLLALMK